MAKTLIDEPPLLVLPSLAAAIGLPEAIFLQQLHYWLESNGHVQADGRKWIFNTYEQWVRQMPWWNIGTVRRIVNTLRQLDLISTTTEWNRQSIDHTLWYTINYDALDQLPASAEEVPPAVPPAPEPIASVEDTPAPSAENDTSSAENDRRSAQIEQTIRANCADDARNLRASVTENTTETLTENSGGGGGPEIDQKSPSLSEKNTRAHTHTPAREGADLAHPQAIAAAFDAAGLADLATRRQICTAWPGLTIREILGWHNQRLAANAAIANPKRHSGPGVIAYHLLHQNAPDAAHLPDEEQITGVLRTAGLLPPAADLPAQRHRPALSPAEIWEQIVQAMNLDENMRRLASRLHGAEIDGVALVVQHPRHDLVSKRLAANSAAITAILKRHHLESLYVVPPPN